VTSSVTVLEAAIGKFKCAW